MAATALAPVATTSTSSRDRRTRAATGDDRPARDRFVPVVAVALHARTTPLAVRERAAFAPGRGAAAHLAARAGVTDAFVLSTCNRIELYAVAPRGGRSATVAALLALLAERSGLPVECLRPMAEVRVGTEAARHLCRIAAGLDSVIFGETQITGQLRRALADARADGVLGPVLHRLGSTALAAGRRVRPLVSAGDSGAPPPLSMVEVAVRAVGGADGLRGRDVLVLGAGDTARDVLALVARAGARRVTVVNRSPERAAALAARHGADVAPWDALDGAVAAADVVFACTAADAPIVVRAQLARAAHGRRTGDGPRPVAVVDLGVPRNVHADVAALPHVTVWNVETLAPSYATAAGDTSAADAEVDRWARRFTRWLRARDVVPTIAQLRASADAVREQELARALARLDGLDARERDVVRALASRLVNKLLHAPVAALAAEPRAHEAAARRLFGLDRDVGMDREAPVALLDPANATEADALAACTPPRPRIVRRAAAPDGL
ncbi:glutamyl-tRNA reductase [Gemmatimonadetes bacterium T265]|nr:glutamyl-tRNA reductase [Gemmatimonadetes bacterium T265]